jgi:hypothetical protein
VALAGVANVGTPGAANGHVGPRVAFVAGPGGQEVCMTANAPTLDPNRLTPEQAAKLLSAAAKVQISVEHITQDIAAGAPTHTDGTISLVQYAAWIVRELAHGD